MKIREFDKTKKVFLADLAVNRAARRVLQPGEYEWFEVPECAFLAGIVYQDGINLLEPDQPAPVAKQESIEKLLGLPISTPSENTIQETDNSDKQVVEVKETVKKPTIKKDN